MASNPFDQLADDFRATIPGAAPPASQQQQPQTLTMGPPPPVAAPAAPKQPAMNPPPSHMGYGGGGGMMGGPGMGMNGGGGPPPFQGGMGMNGNMMGGPPQGNMMGGPPPQQGGMMGGPPPPQQGGMMGGPPPPQQGGMMGGPPPPQQGGMMGGPPPPQQGGMMGGPPQFQGGGMLVPSTQQSNPYANMLGGPPPPPAAWGQAPPAHMGPPGGPPGGAPPNMFPGNMGAPGGPPPPPPPPPNQSPHLGGQSPQVGGPFGGGPPPPPAPAPTNDPLAAAWGAPPPAPTPAPPSGGNDFDIFGGPVAPPAAAPPGPHQRQPSATSFGGPPPAFAGGPPPPNMGPPPPGAAPYMQQQQPPPQHAPAPPNDGGFGGLFDPMGASPAPAPPAADPWGPSLGAAPHAAPPSTALVPAATNSDPWGDIFGSPAPAPPAPPAPVPAAAPNDDWFGAGVGSTITDGDATTVGGGDTVTGMGNQVPQTSAPVQTEPSDFYSGAAGGPSQSAPKGDGQLPEGGEFFDARIFTPTLGVMFFKPQELKDSLFLQTDPEMVDMLEERPVVAFIVEGSSARCAGVELGNVLLKVNGISVKNPKEASRLIKEGPRPLPLLFYVPNTSVVVAEGEHMVKYDTRETGAPLSAKDWKPKYVVIGGIIAQPSMMNMYRSKAEYDIAVIETQARRPVSVKVKQFSLQGARIQNDWQGPQMVKYKNKLHPWKFIVVLPVSRNPIKISSTNLSQLKPVHEGIRRVLMAQQRGTSSHIQGPTAAPVRQDPYQQRGYSGGQQQQQQPTNDGGMSSVRRKTMNG